MTTMRRFIFIVSLLCTIGYAAQATIKLPALISDNMVLQQQSVVTLWGWASPGEKISVEVSWNKKKYAAVTDITGNWQLKVRTVKAGGPYSISFTGENSITVKNVLLGEVWLASGQSNMEFPVGKSEGWRNGVHNYATEIPKANYPDIRMIDVPNLVADSIKNDFVGQWKVCDTTNVKEFSGVAYFFSKEILAATGCPVGIINSTWGGTPAESWTKRSVLESDTGFAHILDRYQKLLNDYPAAYQKYKTDLEQWKADTSSKKKRSPSAPLGSGWNKSPSKLYNGMIAPLINYKVKGVIWYQGESNAEYAWQYRRLFPAMIKSWREDFKDAGMPFYFVQITPHKGQNPVIREAQLFSWQTVAKTGMVVTTDYGDANNIHPRNKEVVGKRLSLWALKNQYGKKNIETSGPVYKKMKIEGNKIRLYFGHDKGLLSKDGKQMQQFSIAAANDSSFIPAQAIIENNSVLIWSDAVQQPADVRYGWQNVPAAELYNSAGLPATPFRTDKRTVPTQGKE
jgi:sialate O-acetylesterase